ncbi:MAG: hypothetical protein HRU21_11740 [Pseudomonadales bacterium]|nr:hypothetical protein [Pseudomonadales bacterium]
MELQRITVAVPAALMTPANHVQYLMGKASGPNDVYTEVRYTDPLGMGYAVSSGLWTAEQIAGVMNPDIISVMQEAGRVPEDCDLDYVAEAQYVFEFFDVENCIGPVDPLKITAVAGVDPQAVLAVMQLEAIPVPDEDEE